jgi:hypothetical protein
MFAYRAALDGLRGINPENENAPQLAELERVFTRWAVPPHHDGLPKLILLTTTK